MLKKCAATAPTSNFLGKLVEIVGLQGRPELNGRVGTVEGWEPSTSRYEVHVAPRHDRVHVRPRNVILPAGSRATITGLVAAPEHNGVVGRVASHDVASGRYHIETGAESGGGAGGQGGDGAGGAMGGASTAHWLSVKRGNAVL